MKPKVTLLSHTKDVLETLWLVWETSRSKESLETIIGQTDFKDKHSFDNFFSRIIQEDIPVAEMVDFVFLLEGVSISLREQLVRHRIGVKVGPTIGVDQVPDLGDSSFWSQSMRILDMSQFATKEEYIIPESIGQNSIAKAIYQTQMQDAQATYRSLAGLKIPLEDARQVIPLGTTHQIVWKLNLASLKKIVGKRSCWILQLDLWKPIIIGMIDELCKKISPTFRELVTPPCYERNRWKGCHFCENNRARIEGIKDEIPPCPIFLAKDKNAFNWCEQPESNKWQLHFNGSSTLTVKTIDETAARRFENMVVEYSKFWGEGYFNFGIGEENSQANGFKYSVTK